MNKKKFRNIYKGKNNNIYNIKISLILSLQFLLI